MRPTPLRRPGRLSRTGSAASSRVTPGHGLVTCYRFAPGAAVPLSGRRLPKQSFGTPPEDTAAVPHRQDGGA
ncbi:hypothetical protein A6P39_038425 [Streptomyces sp. FXJ1.172]|uniref:hypothetical protein n=1 Tax=Streptomyces sp. FXJ1.172 TaxID=710705 RepID=UPI0007D0035C|nr:hypothetical protein [Streptomyces sp. FXJ1.172]WEO99447.1 hypothetical protein A6P39_038425 [Streptomyces sp. FXJ1.172]